MTVARLGPTSAISSKKTTKASAVHTTASPTTDQTTFADGHSSGACATPIGA